MQTVECIELVLGVVLQLGNIQIIQKPKAKKTEACKLDNVASEYVAKILGISKQKLTTLLTNVVVRAAGESVIKPCSLEQAEEIRDTLAQNIYHRLFNWLVQKLNSLLKVDGKPTTNVISILDCCGFDSDEAGPLSQLYLNIANEQLHFYFLSHLFTAEMKDLESQVCRERGPREW